MADTPETPEIKKLREHLEKVAAKQEDAKNKLKEASAHSKNIESLNDPKDIENKKTETLLEVKEAKAEIERAEAEHKESAKKLREEKLKYIPSMGPTIAGYKPLELIKAVAVPPDLGHKKESAPKELLKVVEQETNDLKKKIAETKKKAVEVETKVKSIEPEEDEDYELSKKPEATQHSFNKFLASQKSPASFKAFMIAGIAFLLLGFIMTVTSSPLVGIAMVMIGILELSMGIVIKKVT